MALARLGLKRSDVTFKEIGVNRLVPVRTGAVDATVLGEPHRSQALAEGLLPLIDLFGERIRWLYSGLVVSKRYLKENRGAVIGFMKATIEANRIAVHDAARGKAVLARELDITDAKTLDATYANFKAATPLNAELSLPGAENVVKYTVVANASPRVEDYIDRSIGEELVKSGFIAAMDKTYR